MSTRLCCWPALVLLLPSAAAAQTPEQRAIAGSVALAQFRQLLGTCDTVPQLRALSGGGVLKLERDEVMRLPYGVAYQFRHRVRPETDFVLVSLAVGSQRQTVEATPLANDAHCYIASIPPLPINQTVTLIEQIGEYPTTAQKSAMLAAIAELRRRFIERLYAGQYNAGILNHKLRESITADLPNLLDTTSLSGFVLRDSLVLLSLIDIVVDSFSDAAVGLTELPAAVIQVSAFARNLGTLAASPTICDALTVTDRAILRGLANRIQSLREIGDPAQIALLYSEDGPLPVPASLALEAEGALRRGCAGHVRFDEFLLSVALLQSDPLRPVIEALRAARTLIERSFSLTSTDVFPGATTTLQRYGQLDVVNGYLRGRDEVRLLASFSFYPARRRYGAEIRPHDVYDRLVLSVGYSVATAASDSSDDARDRRIFTAGGGFRINDFFSVGLGQWFDGREHDWYFSFSGDLGGLPFLRNMFARKPEDQ